MPKIAGFICGALVVLIPGVLAQQKPKLEKVRKVQRDQKPTPAPGLDRLTEMQSRLERMMAEFEREFGYLPGPKFKSGQGFPGWNFFGPGQSRTSVTVENGISIKITPESVRVEIKTKDGQGKEEVKVYEAKNMADLQRLHPEVAKRIQRGHGFTFQTPPTLGKTPGIWGPFGWRRPGGVTSPQIPALSKYKLGVYIKDVPAAVADYLDLRPGEGLLVDQILPGSLAEKLGIKAKDLVLRVNGATVRGVDSVAAGLQATPPDGKVKVVVLRKGLKVTLQAVRKTPPKPLIKKLKRI